VQSLEWLRAYQRRGLDLEHQACCARARSRGGPSCASASGAAPRSAAPAVRRDTLREDVCARCASAWRLRLTRAAPQFDLQARTPAASPTSSSSADWTLLWAERHAELVTYSDNIRQLESLASIDLVPQATVDVLTSAYRAYRQRLHHLALEGAGNGRARVGVAAERAAVTAIWDAALM